ncbi:hypothetical protein PSACC_02488 [Paramicrosporidium saccamoebae]|uniref:Uncharacterized protein n=1 Tax=Paramicrosporidium saccamoebae TaxID=1246581 RepID=A0A2H9TIZ1_9FUNG|nr:hypothetical protein PSACC_02488 [Paramicrosporidium saccamoebae]
MAALCAEMGLVDFSLTLLLTPILFSFAVLRLVTCPIPVAPNTRPFVKGNRGRLVLFAIDETSLPAVRWSLCNLLSESDYVHILHIVEAGDETSQPGDKVVRSRGALHQVQCELIKGLFDCCEEFRRGGVNFDGQVRSRKANESTADMILTSIAEVEPDIVLLGSSQRLGE